MNSLPIFSTFARTATDVDVEEITRDILGANETVTTTRGARTEVRGPDVLIDIDSGRGGIWSGDLGRMWQAEPMEAPDERAAVEIGQAALERAHLAPKLNGQFRFNGTAVRYGQVAMEQDGERKTHRSEAVYSREIVVDASEMRDVPDDTLPLFGGGGKFTVTIGDGGQVVGLSGAWRQAEAVDERPVMPVEEAIAAAGLKPNGELRIRSSRLGYYAAPAFVGQDLMFPVYAVQAEVYNGRDWVPSRVRLIPATDVGTITPPEMRQPKRSKPRDFVADLRGAIEAGRPLPADLTISSRVLERRGIKPEQVLTRSAGGKIFVKPQLSSDLIQVLLEALRRRSFGTSWIGEWGGLGGSQANAQGFVDELTAEGWQRRFNWGNQAAWKTDWLSNDDDYVDDVDFVFYTGHAGPDGWQLASGGEADWLHFSEVGTSPNVPSDHWGQENLEWVTIAACGPLEDDLINGGGNVFDRWRAAFDGLHLLMGYAAVTYDNSEEGRRLASYARSGMTLMQAWFRTAQEIQPTTNGWDDPYGPDVFAAAMYIGDARGDTAGDHLWGHGAVGRDIRNSTYRGCSFVPC